MVTITALGLACGPSTPRGADSPPPDSSPPTELQRAPAVDTAASYPALYTQPGPLGDALRALEQALPEPASLSQSNGASLECPHHGGATYNLLEAIANDLPITDDDDLVTLAAWARHTDVCLRQIALSAVVSKIGFDRNELVLPHMHEPEHYVSHQIFVALAGYLDRSGVTYDRGVFAGLHLAPQVGDFAELVHGTWDEVGNPKELGFIDEVRVGEEIRVTTRNTEPDPAWPDHTWTTGIGEVTVNAQQQFVIAGEWSRESNANGYVGPEQRPSPFVFKFWPVADGVVWYLGASGAYWKQLQRR